MEENSDLLSNQSKAILSVSNQLDSLSEQVTHNILHLENGFERLQESIHLTEMSVLSLSRDNRNMMIVGTGGFLLGTFAGLMRWIVIGMNSFADLW